ncbi:hypothetical protein [Sulfuritalea sp.]|uniref:hypothetical protein n=1 Tax=Sulfuritalea sp. TaxID=2480090 RepID=UPI001AC38872|nr:hypothetical protein [Sulfuritalea sp.]MBN8476775.1 hypothetical protein [Sulfuritalea sp.]
MGFLLGITHKVVGPVLVCEGDLKKDIWTYLSNGDLTHDGNFLNKTIRLPKTLTTIEELDSHEDRQRITGDIRERFQRLSDASLLVGSAAMVSPIAYVVTAAINESNKEEIAANLPPSDLFTCFRGTLKDRRSFVAVTLRSTFEKITELLVKP